ncbi:MAG TPA: hypothetical protein VGO58_19985, partial [Chitinophagaceae bacterium]|nr:hypothetical protein [Chitinophagaceae bacterium]
MRSGLLLLCFFIALLPAKIFSQTIVTIGAPVSTSSTSGPANSTTAADRNERHTAIYSVAELNAAGLSNGSAIMSIAWEKTGAAQYYSENIIFRVWIKHNAATNFAAVPVFATEITGATLVYETTTFSMPAAAGVLSFPFNTATPSFIWNGTQNLQVITELIRPTDWTEVGFLWRTISTVTNGAANANGTIAAPGTFVRTSTRPQVRLGISAAGTDAAINGITSPVSGPAGSQNITVLLRNSGNTTLTAANIAWTIDGGAPANFAWAGSLVPGAVSPVTVGSNSFSGGAHIIGATVTSANGSPDINPANNSATKNILVCSPMSGAYTINKGAPTLGTNFNSFNDFSTALSNCGVGGHVTATVVDGSGPYTEQVVFQNIPGIGAGASVTIEGNAETITTSAPIIQTGSNPNRHIIRLIGVQYFTINNLDIDMFPGSTGFIGIHILNSG